MPSSIQPSVLAARARRSRAELKTRNCRNFGAMGKRQYSRTGAGFGRKGSAPPSDMMSGGRWPPGELCSGLPAAFPLVTPLSLWYEYVACWHQTVSSEERNYRVVSADRVVRSPFCNFTGSAKGDEGMAFCAKCGGQLAEGMTFCGACGAPVGAAAPAPPPAAAANTGSGLTSNTAGALAYVTIIPAILFLVMEPYNKDRFIRFHAFQCLFFAGAMFVLSIVFMIVAVVLGFIPIVGWILDLLMWLTFS